MQKKIFLKPKGNEETISHLQEVLSVDRPISVILTQRGITGFDEAKDFFRPELKNLLDPFLMKDMNKAVERLEKAIQKNEKILVYGDYDVDGTTSVALVYSFLRGKHNSLDYYIPDRYSEGYGISFKGIDYAKETGASLVIALDCGIKAVEKIEYANSKGIDFIICDHHTAGDKIPNAIAVLDPKRPDCDYPFKELSGCGVGFKLLQAFSNRNSISFDYLYSFIDLVAVSIASDIVPVIGENRILTYFGLKKLNENPLKGLNAIKKIAGINGTSMTVSDCVFKIGPRINAAGRIKSGKEAVSLLISEDIQKAKEFGEQIDLYNTDRKNFDRNITHEALREMGNNIDFRNKKSTVIYNKDWHKGVVGIVASRLTETYYRPTVVLTESNGFAAGSARSVADFNLYKAIDSCSHLLENFGGHTFAAGLTLKIENIQKFTECFEKYVSENITEAQQIPIVETDIELNFYDITPKFFRIIKQLAPFGPGNMSPVFVTKNILDTGKTSPVGKNKEHLKMEMTDSEGNILSGIGFSLAHNLKKIKEKVPFTICYSLEENNFRGEITIQAMVKEIFFEDEQSE